MHKKEFTWHGTTIKEKHIIRRIHSHVIVIIYYIIIAIE